MRALFDLIRLAAVEHLIHLAIKLVPRGRPEAAILAACLSRYIELAVKIGE